MGVDYHTDIVFGIEIQDDEIAGVVKQLLEKFPEEGNDIDVTNSPKLKKARTQESEDAEDKSEPSIEEGVLDIRMTKNQFGFWCAESGYITEKHFSGTFVGLSEDGTYTPFFAYHHLSVSFPRGDGNQGYEPPLEPSHEFWMAARTFGLKNRVAKMYVFQDVS